MPATATAEIDVRVENHGSLFMFRVLTDAARAWVDEHVPTEDWQWMGNGFSVEHRYARDLAQGMLDDGLNVK
jgi:hypothetical protein